MFKQISPCSWGEIPKEMIVEGGHLKINWEWQLGKMIFTWLTMTCKIILKPRNNSQSLTILALCIATTFCTVTANGQNCDVDFPGISNQLYSNACGGGTTSLSLGKSIFMDDNDIFTFDAPSLINIQGNLTVSAQGDGTIIIPAGVTVIIDGDVQLDAKNGGCQDGNQCVFTIVVNGTLQINGSLQNRLVELVWEGIGVVQVVDRLENTNNGCMYCGLTCPQFPAGPGGCQDSGSTCSTNFCTNIYGANCPIDIIDPTITGCPGDQLVSTGTGSCDAIVNWTPPKVSDNCGVASFSSSHNPGDVFPLGVTLVTYTAKDDNGNTSSCTFNVEVVDNAAPVITGCPADITAITMDCNQVSVNWTPPTATDNCKLATMSSTHNPGDFFPIGQTTVTYTATDERGIFSTCSFLINVVDNQTPIINNCPGDLVVEANANCHTSVSWTSPSATDNCTISSFSSDYKPGESFAIGTTTVTYTALDQSGNSSTCSFTVTVEDRQAPQFTDCPSDIIASEIDPITKSALVSWKEPLATDNCLMNSLTSTHQPGDTFLEGQTVVTYSALDEAGNMQTCSFTVVVKDNNTVINDKLSVYKAFSPNGDGINDLWNIGEIEQYPDNTVTIFDRWGSIIFQASGYNNENIVWDGTGSNGRMSRGSVVPPGTYFYSIRIHGIGSMNGYVELVK